MSNTADRVDLVVAVFVVRDLRAARDWCCDSAAFFLFYVVHTTHTKFIIIIIIKSNLRFFFARLCWLWVVFAEHIASSTALRQTI